MNTYYYLRAGEEGPCQAAAATISSRIKLTKKPRLEHFKGSSIRGRSPGKESPQLAAA